jgi:DNA-binding SARP family transcriptional activator/tetratricopeptide (TPR) repeat protein/DNA-binding XRE family transcriptional regulator
MGATGVMMSMFDGSATPRFGALLRTHRRAAGLSQRDLAARAGVSAASVRDVEQGRTRRPHPAATGRLIRALNLTGAAAEALGQAATPSPSRLAVVDGRVRMLLLGPLEVHYGQADARLTTDMQRTILGRLAVTPGEAVSRAELIELLWGLRPPRSAVNLVQTYVARLRRMLQPGAQPSGVTIVSSHSAGYLLRAEADQLDLLQFRRLVQQADAVPPDAAADLLERALRWWRGDPVADVAALAEHPRALALTTEHIEAALRYADLTASADRHDRSLPVLRELAERHPLHEPLWGRLTVALAATGLQAAALRTFDLIRRRLADELGVDPGPELAERHQLVLRQRWSATSSPPPPGGVEPAEDRPEFDGHHPPAQLPADLGPFTGRSAALARLDRTLDAGGPPTTVVITALSGTAGVGKTTLAVHWAHRVRDRFPDGQLYVNLRGFHPSGDALTPGEALEGFLTALGLPPTRVPPTPDQQSACFRTLLADRRVLVLLDNARDAEQVRPLLPGAPGCLVLITSRRGLAGLVAAEAAQVVPLDLLSRDEAEEFLARRLGAGRTAAERGAVDTIIDRCARLPLALAIAAAHLSGRPEAPLADLATELTTRRGRLDTLSTGDHRTDVRAVFSWSYQALEPAATRLFRLLGLHPGADFSRATAASLTGLAPARVAPLLAELCAASLLSEPVSGRYAFHDLLQAYAAELARDEEPAPARRAAMNRLFDDHLRTARTAMRLLFPAESPVTADVPASDEALTGPEAARAWLDAERANLVVVAGHAARHDRPDHTTALAATLYRYLDSGYLNDALVLHTSAVHAARAAGVQRYEATASTNLGVVHRRSGRFELAAEYHERALAIDRRLGDGAGEARALAQLGIVHWRLGRHTLSRQLHQASLDLFRKIGDQLGEATQLNYFGIGSCQAGALPEAVDFHQQALVLFRRLGHRFGEADVLDSLGCAYHRMGDHQQAIDCHRRAQAMFEELGYRLGEISALNNLGHALVGLGDPDAARSHHQQALVLCRETGERSFEVEAVNGLGAASLAAGDIGSAAAHYTAALSLAESTGDRYEQASAHRGLADVGYRCGDLDRAHWHRRQARDIHADLGLPDVDKISAGGTDQ